MLKYSLCVYSDTYIPVKGRITITRAGVDVTAIHANERDKGLIFKNCAPSINCKTEVK